ncbi:MAG: phosphoribosylaminoimidazolesuccinocarboxamide synthase [Leptolyngbya sp. PLA3]|nr:MAG: phosphoribosylaminoimidazolesuccinocarboxamide synthase [Cyanobacteria bacterium CYA]MCE7967583.1 phosphoribosylaminoimidazolesuccinocarboxamide synthase [Leptolyngbya sp. PL-A3]
MTPVTHSQRAVRRTDLILPDRREGKVRDLYRVPDIDSGRSAMLLIASDRLSAFDVVLPTAIPGKGILLTQIAAFWLRKVEQEAICRTHLLSTDVSKIPAEAFEGCSTTREDLEGRCMIGRLCKVVPIECVVRGYLEGSGWKDYQQTGSVCGVPLPKGLKQCDRLPEPILTPATKAEQGMHDENISFQAACDIVGRPLMEKLRDLSVRIYNMAARHAEQRGIIIADTKFEFGIPLDGRADPILIDEALTPDSSRFWPADTYQPGRSQRSFDKQFVREYLEGLVSSGQWNKTAPGPELPDAVVQGTLDRYREACNRLTA